MFSGGSPLAKEWAKLDVLESKLNIYEALSREMLDKLENAVDKISESNQRIATILAKHDERIDQATRNDELIIKMIEDVKHQNTREHKATLTRIENIEKTIDDLSKFRWQAGAVAGLAVLVVGICATIVTPLIDNMFPPQYNNRTGTPMTYEFH